MGLILILRFFGFRSKRKCRFINLFIFILLLFSISLFKFFLWNYVLYHLGILCSKFLSRILVFSVGGSLPLPSKQVGLRLKRITLGLMSSWNHGKNLRKRAREWISLNQKQDMCCLLLKYLPGGTKLVHRIIPHEWSPICINWMK